VSSIEREPVMKYPGEDAPLPFRHGGQPISDDEAVGVARRYVREQNEVSGKDEPLPTELPLPQEPGRTPIESFRLPRRRKWRARARADMEGRSLTDVINEALEAYANASPGSTVQYVLPSAGGAPRPGRRRSRSKA